MFLTHDLSNVSDDFRGTYHLNKIYVKYSWHHFTSYQFFPSDWYNLNLSQEKSTEEWTEGEDWMNKYCIHDTIQSSIFLMALKQMLVKCCFCLQCMTIQSEINDCLKHCFKSVLEVNSFSKPVYIKNLFEVKSHFHRNAIQNKQN